MMTGTHFAVDMLPPVHSVHCQLVVKKSQASAPICKINHGCSRSLSPQPMHDLSRPSLILLFIDEASKQHSKKRMVTNCMQALITFSAYIFTNTAKLLSKWGASLHGPHSLGETYQGKLKLTDFEHSHVQPIYSV